MLQFNAFRRRLFTDENSPTPLLKVMFFTFTVHIVYWFLLPFQNIISHYTQVPTLWEAGWFRTVPWEYSRLCVENGVLPYTMPDLPGYPFKYLEYPFLVGYFSYVLYAIAGGNFHVLCSIFQLTNIVFQVGNGALIYLIANFFHSERRSLHIGYLYSIMPTILWHSMSRYDSIPTFFMLLSLFLFLEGRLRSSYFSMAIGALFKFFPALLGLIYLKNGYQLKRPFRYYVELVLIPASTVFILVLPLLVMNPMVLPWLFGFIGSFGWNWESVWGPIDQLVRPVFPSLAIFFIDQVWMRVIFVVACLSVMVLSLKSRLEIVNGLAYSILAWLQTQWFFSPQYIMWISPLLLILSFSNRFVVLYILIQIVMFFEQPAPFHYLAPGSALDYVLFISSIRIFLFTVVIVILLKERILGRAHWFLSKLRPP